MNPEARIFYNLAIRAVTGKRPALIVAVADDKVLTDLCEQLARAERVADLLAHKGYSKAGDPIDKTVASLPLPFRPVSA